MLHLNDDLLKLVKLAVTDHYDSLKNDKKISDSYMSEDSVPDYRIEELFKTNSDNCKEIIRLVDLDINNPIDTSKCFNCEAPADVQHLVIDGDQCICVDCLCR